MSTYFVRIMIFFFLIPGELNIAGSAARLQAGLQVLFSLIKQKGSLYLRQTTLAKDALNDEGTYVTCLFFISRLS